MIQTISVFVLMKQRVSALTVQSLLSAENDMEVIVLDQKCSNLSQLSDFAPEVVITDLETCSRQPAESIQALREKGVTRFLFLYKPSKDSTSAAISLGADGLISKSSPSHELSLAVRALASGKCWIDENIWRDYLKKQNQPSTTASVSFVSELTRELPVPQQEPVSSASQITNAAQSEASIPCLTKREMEVLRLAALGWSNKQIALNMELSVETINCYMWLIAKKLHARGRIQAVDTARQSGIVS